MDLLLNIGLVVLAFIGMEKDSGYGIFQLLFHEIHIHRRVTIPFTPEGEFLKGIMNGHSSNPNKHSIEGFEAFGFLYAHNKYTPNEN
jgi:beta-carotene 3-hydroxylase